MLLKRLVVQGILVVVCALVSEAKVVRVDDLLEQQGGLGKVTAEMVQSTVERAVASMRPGDALLLPMRHDLGRIRIDRLSRHVQIIGGRNGVLEFGCPVRNVMFFGTDNVDFVSSPGLGKGAASSAVMEGVIDVAGNGGINLTGTVTNSHWIGRSMPHGSRLKVDGNVTNSIMVWLRYRSEQITSGDPSILMKLNGSGQGFKLLDLIEHNQGNKIQAVVIDGGVGVQLANGATEGCGVPAKGVYQLINCRGVHLAQREMFSNHRPTSSWYGAPSFGLVVSGEGNIIDNLQEYANPQALSLVNSDEKVQIWSSSFEDSASLGSSQGQFLAFFVDNSMIKANDQFSEPRLIDGEVVCAWRDASGNLIDLTQPGATPPAGVTIPTPPSMPVCDIPAPDTLLYKKAAGFGRKVLLAGADPTGRKSSTEAFEKLLWEDNVLELPPGTFRLDRPLRITSGSLGQAGVFGGRKAWLIGSGSKATRIVGPASGSAIVIGEQARHGLAHGAATESRSAQVLVEGVCVMGSDTGFTVNNKVNVVLMNDSMVGQSFAGLAILSTGGAEQNLYISLAFRNTGSYGIYMDGYQDKELFYRCRFEGQKKAGIYGTKTSKFHSGVYQCSFRNITGPGFSVTTGNDTHGYGNWVFTVDSCTFIECGSETEPVIDFGYSRLSVLSHTKVTTTGKKVFAGFRGQFAVIDNVTFNLSLAGENALVLGHQRFDKTCGLGGSRLTNVTTNGKIAFLDYEQYVTGAYKIDSLYSTFPWRFGYIFYKVQSDNYKVEYALVNEGKVTDLPGYPKSSVRPGARPNSRLTSVEGVVKLYDIRGRLAGTRGDAALRKLSSGLYVRHLPATREIKRAIRF